MNPTRECPSALALLLAVAPLALPAQTEPVPAIATKLVPAAAEVRLSGVVAVDGVALMAVVESAGQGGRMVRVGDSLPDGTRVLEIGSDWIRVSQGGEERVLRVSSLPPTEPPIGPATAAEPKGGDTTQTPPEAPTAAWSAAADAELLDTVMRLASDPLSSEDDLGPALAPLLDLPADARIRPFFPGEPEREEKGLKELSASLARGEPVRLMVESGGQTETIYLMKEQGRGDSSQPVQP